MDNHHEEPKPTTKWIATPILMAFFTIAALVTFLSFASGTCCGGECKDKKAKTEEHGTTNEHGTTTDDHSEEVKNDTTATTTDSTVTNEGNEGHEEHNEGEGHGH